MNTNTEKYKNIIVPIILNHLPKARIILYGSRARNDAKEGSDIDVAIDNGQKIDRNIMTNIYFDIDESSLPISFDVIDLHAVSDHMREQIRKDGVLWHN